MQKKVPGASMVAKWEAVGWCINMTDLIRKEHKCFISELRILYNTFVFVSLSEWLRSLTRIPSRHQMLSERTGSSPVADASFL